MTDEGLGPIFKQMGKRWRRSKLDSAAEAKLIFDVEEAAFATQNLDFETQAGADMMYVLLMSEGTVQERFRQALLAGEAHHLIISASGGKLKFGL